MVEAATVTIVQIGFPYHIWTPIAELRTPGPPLTGRTVRDVFRLTVPQATDEALVEALERVKLWQTLQRSSDHPLAHSASKLSAGECQRLMLARALVASTPIVILDEPDANLDAAGMQLLLALLREQKGVSIAIAAHSAELVALGDELVRLGRGSPDLQLAPASK